MLALAIVRLSYIVIIRFTPHAVKFHYHPQAHHAVVAIVCGFPASRHYPHVFEVQAGVHLHAKSLELDAYDLT